MRRTVAVSSLFLALNLWTGASFAEDEAASRALYEDGLRLLNEGKTDAACGRLEESLAQKYNLNVHYFFADCLEKQGRVVSAWTAFLNVASKAKAGGERSKATTAEERARALEPHLPRLTISVASELPGLRVERNGTMVPKGMWGAPIPMDPGAVTIRASATGKKTWTTTVVIERDKTVPVAIPELEDAPSTESAAKDQTVPLPISDPPSPQHASQARSSPMRTMGWIGLGTGAVALAVGGVVFFVGKSAYDDAMLNCGANVGLAAEQCNPGYASKRNGAVDQSQLGGWLFVGGAVLAAAGTAFVLLAPSREHPTSPRASLHWMPNGLLLSGEF